METKLEGSCLCGGIAFEISGKIGALGACHCSMCRKVSGSAFAVFAMVRSKYFRFTRGEDLVRRYESSPGRHRCFCGRCGATLGEIDLDAPSFPIAAGLLDGDPGRRLAGHEYVGSKAEWYAIEDSLPRHDEGFPPLD